MSAIGSPRRVGTKMIFCRKERLGLHLQSPLVLFLFQPLLQVGFPDFLFPFEVCPSILRCSFCLPQSGLQFLGRSTLFGEILLEGSRSIIDALELVF